MREDGTFIKATYGSHFMFSLNLHEDKDISELMPGNYIVMIDPNWNESARLVKDFKNVLVDIYAPEAVKMEPLD